MTTAASTATIADYAVVGGGILGAAVARQLVQSLGAQVVVLEKEAQPAEHQTGRNSGVVHSGVYYKPGSLKALNCTRGRVLIEEYAAEHGIAYERCGKIIVATDEAELPRLQKLLDNGRANGLADIRLVDPQEIREIEPHAGGLQAIYVPYTGIIDYAGVTRKLLQEVAEACGAQSVKYNAQVHGLTFAYGHYSIRTAAGVVRARRLIGCAGLQSDRLAQLDGLPVELRIVPFRGDYYVLSSEAAAKVRGLIYPVPNPEFPFLGVHFTKMVLGGAECGPNAVFSFKREGYHPSSFSLADTVSALGYVGTWKLFGRHWRYGWGEYARAWSKAAFVASTQKLMPGAQSHDFVSHRAGVRAQALAPDGNLIDDFTFADGPHSMHVVNAPSPAATACLAIAQTVVERIRERGLDH